MMTNEKANTILDVFKTMEELKKNGDIQYINYEWDEKNNTFNITTVPKKTVEHIEVNFTITPSGTTFQ
jgi:hypothetical protein